MRTVLNFLFVCGLSVTAASATSLQFVQDGWSTGAILSVVFTGEDTDGDGAITLPELTVFNAQWGNTTNWNLPNIEPDGFFFTDLNNYLFFARNPNFSIVSTAFEGAALASVFDESLFPVDSSSNPSTATPEPGGLLLTGLAAIAIGLWRRRRSGACTG